MSTRNFISPARLGWSACSLLLATSVLGCGGAPESEPEPDSESESVDARSDALDQCQTYDILQVDGDEGEGVRCSATICVKPNGCQWDHLICEDGWNQTNESNCWSAPVAGCYDDWDCPYQSRCNDWNICEYY